MIKLVHGPATEMLLTMSNEELANEAMALTMMCDITAQGRQQIRGVLDAYAGDRERQAEVGSIVLESLLRRTCASMVYSCLPYPTMEVMSALEQEDKTLLEERAVDVVKSMKILGLPEEMVSVFEKETIPYILGKYNAVIDTTRVLKDIPQMMSEKQRGDILQEAFEKGVAYAGLVSGGTASNGDVPH